MITEIRQPNNLYLKWIDDIKGWGVFTDSVIHKNDVVEVCYCIIDNYETSALKDYVFSVNGNTMDVCHCLGYGAIYNHSYDNNIIWEAIHYESYILIEFTAARDIEIGEELCHNYSNIYWEARVNKKLI